MFFATGHFVSILFIFSSNTFPSFSTIFISSKSIPAQASASKLAL
jgi:hypothetical protein